MFQPITGPSTSDCLGAADMSYFEKLSNSSMAARFFRAGLKPSLAAIFSDLV